MFEQWVKSDKYAGRKVTVENFALSLKEFFFDGLSIRTSVVKDFIAQFTELLNCLEKEEMDGFRFWSSSILLVYEGNPSAAGGSVQPPRLRMIDFAHTVFDRTDEKVRGRFFHLFSDTNKYFTQGDVGYKFGLKSTIKYLGDVSNYSFRVITN